MPRRPEFITALRGQNFRLSSFYRAELVVGRRIYLTNEHYFQYKKARFAGDAERAGRILRAPSPGNAKAIGREVEGLDLERWNGGMAVTVMRKAIRLKFEQHDPLRRFLLNTGDAVIIEGNGHHDNIWGVCWCNKEQYGCHDQGRNLLGHLLMERRARLAAA